MRRLLPWVVVTLWPSLAAAQQTTGDLGGRVLSADGVPLAEALVVTAGPSVQGERDGRSDARGRFLIRSLPPGSYAVSVRRIGFGPIGLRGVPVRLGETTFLGDIRLAAQAVDLPEVVVSSGDISIDASSPALSATLDSARFRALPADRDVRSVLIFLPQANASPFASGVSYGADGVNIAGGGGLENSFYVDGTNVTVGTGNGIPLPSNFVQSVQVLRGYEVEYGRALSGVINVVTPSGGNTFHGQVFGYWTGDQLRTAPRRAVVRAEPVAFADYDIGVSLSGPIRRDRLWYFVAYDPTISRQDAALGALPTLRDTRTQHLIAGKLTWRTGPHTNLAATVIADPYTRNRLEDVLPATTDPAATLGRETGGGYTISLIGRHELSPTAQVILAVSQLQRHVDFGTRSGATDVGAITRLQDQIANASSSGPGGFDNTSEGRTGIRVALSAVAGAHSLKVGAEFEDNRYADSGYGSTVTLAQDGTYTWSQNYGFEWIHNRVPALYAQDTWELSPRFRVSAGLRWEAQYLSADVGPTRTVPNEFSPRAGIVFLPGDLGRQRLFASAGRFYEQVAPEAAIFWNSTGFWRSSVYPNNPLVDSSNGVVLYHQDFGAIPASPPLKGQSYDQLIVGYEHRLGAAVKLGVNATYRTLRWVIEDGDPGDGSYQVGNPGRGILAAMPRARQHYAALELSFEAFTGSGLSLQGSYVLSRNVGNYTGLYASDFMIGWPNSGPQYDFPDLMKHAYGLLPNDRTHVAKMTVGYRATRALTLGTFLQIASGTPLSEYAASAYDQTYRTFVRARGSAGRTPTTWSIDLHGAYELPSRSGRVRPRVLVDLFNVGSPRTPLLYDQQHYLDAAQTQVNQNYRTVTRYQPPMSARIGMEVSF